MQQGFKYSKVNTLFRFSLNSMVHVLHIHWSIISSLIAGGVIIHVHCGVAAYTRVCEQKQFFFVSLCPLTQRHKSLSSPWFGVFKLIFPRVFFSGGFFFQTPLWLPGHLAGCVPSWLPLPGRLVACLACVNSYSLWRWGVTCLLKMSRAKRPM